VVNVPESSEGAALPHADFKAKTRVAIARTPRGEKTEKKAAITCGLKLFAGEGARATLELIILAAGALP